MLIKFFSEPWQLNSRCLKHFHAITLQHFFIAEIFKLLLVQIETFQVNSDWKFSRIIFRLVWFLRRILARLYSILSSMYRTMEKQKKIFLHIEFHKLKVMNVCEWISEENFHRTLYNISRLSHPYFMSSFTWLLQAIVLSFLPKSSALLCRK